MSRTRLAVALALPVLALAACTSGTAADEPSTSSTSTTPTSAPSTTPTAPSAAATSTAAVASPTSTSPAPTSTASAGTAAPPFTTTCESLTVRVFKGGGIRGMEVAAMQFVNDGTTPCTITGTPSVRLVRKGTVVGSPSRPDGARVRPFTIQPGDYAESLVRVNSTCNAPLSDNVRYRLPTRGGAAGRTVTEPIELRACRITVAPAGAPA